MKSCKKAVFRFSFLAILFFVLCIASVVYGILCSVIASALKVATFIWYIIGAGFLFLGMFCLFRKNKIVLFRIPKWITYPVVSLIAICLVLFVIVEIGVVSHFEDVPAEEPEYLIVLGAGMKNGKPTVHLRNRIETAAAYLLEHPNVTVICCGGQGSDETISEAQCIAEELIRLGVDQERLLLEDQSTRTRENLSNAAEMISKDAKVCIVTNNYHVFRARKYALSEGFNDVSALSAPYSGVMLLHYVVREYVAYVHDVLFGAFTMSSFFR